MAENTTNRAKDIIALYEAELSKTANFRDLYQRTADMMYPRNDQITSKTTPGEVKTDQLLDSTGATASLEMASGLSQNLVPPGQRFFSLRATDREVNALDVVKRYLSRTTDTIHEQLFSSNFMLQFNGTLRALAVFGTGNLFSEYTTFLNFRDHDIGSYLIRENSKARIDTVMKKLVLTARQAQQMMESGEWDSVGKSVTEAMKDEKTWSKPFEFIHKVSPRETFNPRLRDFANMPFESVYVAVKDMEIVSDGGFREFPYHVVRWTKAPNEIWGRGQGTFILPEVHVLQNIKHDFIECANLHNRPPLSILESFSGEVDMSPHALNFVQDQDVIKAIQQQALGSFVITKEVLEMQQDVVKKAFFNDVFVQLANLKGDRRTATEIRERIAEGLQRLGPPIGRLQEELLSPLIERVMFLLMDHGVLEQPPDELQGKNFEIEYVGRLALELKSHQARGAQQWLGMVSEVSQLFPEAADLVNVDSVVRRLGETSGVNEEDINSEERVQEIREARAEQEAAQAQLAIAREMASGYKDVKDAPEAGSPAESLLKIA